MNSIKVVILSKPEGNSSKNMETIEIKCENLALPMMMVAKKEVKKHRTNRYGYTNFALSLNGSKQKTKIDDFVNKIVQGDCLEVMQLIPSKSIDMILCDLPYGTTQNKWDSVIDLQKLWTEYERIVKDNGVIALTSQGVFTARLILSNEKLFKYKITWIKSKSTNFLNAKKQPLRKHEDICIFYKKQPTYNPQMVEGEAYDKGVRKDQYTGSYGDFKPRHVKSNGERYPNDIVFYEEQDVDDFVYIKTAESEGTVYHPTQ
jgi:DNA modification methylase